MWDAVNGGLKPQSCHRNIIQARRAQPYHISPKIYPLLNTYYDIMMHPYAHPQHLKVLQHFVYIQYGCGMQSMRVFSLNHDTALSYRAGNASGQNSGRQIHTISLDTIAKSLFIVFSWIRNYKL